MLNLTFSRAKLRFQCRRGMAEIEMLLLHFFEQQFENLAVFEQQQFATLLEAEDIELWDWLVVKTQCPPLALQAIVNRINQYAAL